MKTPQIHHILTKMAWIALITAMAGNTACHAPVVSPAPCLIEAKPARETQESAADLLRRGRRLYYLERYQEALPCFRKLRAHYPDALEAERAAYAEIATLHQLKRTKGLRKLCDAFLKTWPESEHAEAVRILCGELLVQSGDWPAVGPFYQDLATRYPQSASMDRFVFYQGVAFFQTQNFIESASMFEKYLKDFSNRDMVEAARYYVAMSYFLGNKYQDALAACKEYLTQHPDGRYAGDLLYRIAFIDFNDRCDINAPADQQDAYQKKMADKITRDLGGFLAKHPDDPANGAMYCLMADTYLKVKQTDEAIAAYQKVLQTDSPDDVIQYAFDSATPLMQAKKDWEGIAQMYRKFIERKPDSELGIPSVIQVAGIMAYAGRSAEASEILATHLKNCIANASNEQVEALINEFVKTFLPRKKVNDIDIDAIDQQLVKQLNKITVGLKSATTSARIYYARARLAQMLKRNDLSDLYLKKIATHNAHDLKSLSPALLATSGDILLNGGDVEGAEAMYKRVADHYKDSLFADAGPVGLGYIALARKDPEKALKIFEDALENNAAMSRFKECMLGKLQALVELEKFDTAQSLAEQIVSDRTFRGETAGKAYLLLARCDRAEAAKDPQGGAAKDFLAKAQGIYQRVYIAYQSSPDICAEAYWQAYETAREQHDDARAAEILKELAHHPKLQNTRRAKDALRLNP